MLRRALRVTGLELTSMVLESERRVWLTSVGGVVSVVEDWLRSVMTPSITSEVVRVAAI